MAAFTGTPASSTEYAQQTGFIGGAMNAGRGLQHMAFSYTHALGAGTGEVNLCILPAGFIRTFSGLSALDTSAVAANADIHLGFRAYTEPDGDVVAVDDNFFLDNGDAATGGAMTLIPAAPGVSVFRVRHSNGDYKGKGLVIYAMIDTGNIEDTDTIAGFIVYSN